MKKVIINVDWVPNNFSASPMNENVACVATGRTLEEAEMNIEDVTNALNKRSGLLGISGYSDSRDVENAASEGDHNAILALFRGDWTPVFKLSTRAQLKYTDNYISRKALARETGIAEQQLSHYANGQRHPRPEMQQRISSGIKAICQRLAFIL